MEAKSTPVQRLGWYARRLRSMEKGELFWRLRSALPRPGSRESIPDDIFSDGDDWADALHRFRTGSNRPIVLDRQRAQGIAERKPEFVAELLELADRFIGGSFSFFGHPPVCLKQPIDWHHDPISDVHWPAGPSHRIDHRTAGGNVKWIWELNRLQHLPVLAQAWLFTGDNRYSQAAFDHIDTWIDQNPPGRGIAWRGAFEAGMRSISIAVAVQGLRDAPELTVERYRRTVRVLTYSADRCWRERSLFSSANNHLVGEMAGLAVTSMIFPELRSASGWERRAVKTLASEAQKQILPDGCGAEQSVAYQVATVELLHLVAALLAERDGRAPNAITEAIGRSAEFLAAAVGSSDPDPRFGDSDQEFAVRLGPEPIRTVRDHLGVVATFGWGRAGTSAASDSLSAQWYAAMAQASGHRNPETDTVAVSEANNQNFLARDGGFVVLRRGRCRTTMDVGPLGYLSIAAHGHADALAVTLSDDDGDLIGDPGTGSYYLHPQWRAVMRGTRAHATVCIDGQDQSVIGGPFLWSRHADVLVRGVDLEAGIVDAEHDGYTRLPGRVVHRRWLIAPANDRTQLVVDLVSGEGIHEVRTSWPLHPSVDALRIDGGHTLSRQERPVLQMLHAATIPLSFDDTFGDDTQALGWWSDRLESRQPAWWLSAVCRTELPLVIVTLITPQDGIQTGDLAVAMQNRMIDVEWMEGSTVRTAVVQIDGSAVVVRR